MIEVSVTINGLPRHAMIAPDVTLLEALRETWGLTGAKFGCGGGDCGSCTVMVDGLTVASCLMLAVQADGSEILTIEGVAVEGQLHPLQALFEESAAVQCGYCAPGMIISAKALLDENPMPTRDEIRTALAGNLCRCTGYTKILDVVTSIAQDALIQSPEDAVGQTEERP